MIQIVVRFNEFVELRRVIDNRKSLKPMDPRAIGDESKQDVIRADGLRHDLSLPAGLRG